MFLIALACAVKYYHRCHRHAEGKREEKKQNGKSIVTPHEQVLVSPQKSQRTAGRLLRMRKTLERGDMMLAAGLCISHRGAHCSCTGGQCKLVDLSCGLA